MITPRTVASLLWIALVLVPLLRGALEVAARFLWPSTKFFQVIASPSERWVPFLILVAIGYGLTILVLRYAVYPYLHQERDETSAGEGPKVDLAAGLVSGGLDRTSRAAVLATVGWVVAGALLNVLSVPLLVTAALVILGIGKRRKRPEPRPEPFPVPVPPAPLPPDPEDDDLPPADEEDADTYFRTFSWLFTETPYLRGGPEKRFDLRLAIPKAAYEEFRNRSHEVSGNADYVRFINEDLDGPWVLDTAARLRALSEANGYDELTEIHLAMAFTLSIRYQLDSEEHTGEYPKYPIESLVDKRGDCEDHANLCGAVLHVLGHPTALVLMDIDDSGGHAALAVAADVPRGGAVFRDTESGEDMYYCEVTPSRRTTEETTDVQWWLGMNPPSMAHDFELIPIG